MAVNYRISTILVVVQISLASCVPSWEIDSRFSPEAVGERIGENDEKTQDYHPRWNSRYCHCVYVHDCPAALEVYRKRPRSIYDIDMIRKFSCGLEVYPHFCCNLVVESLIFRHHMKQKRDYHSYRGWGSANNWNNGWNSGWNSAPTTPRPYGQDDRMNHHFFWDSGSFPHWSHAPTDSNWNGGHDCDQHHGGAPKPGRRITTRRPEIMPRPGVVTDTPLAPFPPTVPSVPAEVATPTPTTTVVEVTTPVVVSLPIQETTVASSSTESVIDDIFTSPIVPSTTADPMDSATTRDQKTTILKDQLCGTSLQNRIVGGETAQLGDYPWMARLGYVRNGADRVLFRCGGTLISRRYILTAAHCVTNLPNGLIFTTVRLGELDERTDVDCSGTNCADPPQDFGIERITVHPNYNNPRLSNDIALIRLNDSVRMTEFVSPLCLPLEGTQERISNFTGLRAIVAGWGSTNTGITSGSPTLQWVRLTLIPTEECMETYRSRFAITISQNQICTAGIENMDACEGDSGGPLFLEGDQTRRATLIGIVSFGPRRCGTAALPGVYTNVQSYLDWILDSI